MAGTLPHTWKRALLKACFSNSLCSHHPWAGLNRVLIFHLSRFLSPNFLLSRGASSSSTTYVLHSHVTVVVALAAEPRERAACDSRLSATAGQLARVRGLLPEGTEPECLL